MLFFGVWWFLLRRMGQSQGFMTVGQSKAKIYMEKEVKVTFADVAGVDEAKEELEEIIEFLKTGEVPSVGGKIPAKAFSWSALQAQARRSWPRPWPEKHGVPFFDQRLGVRGNVRRRGRSSRPRPVRTGQEQGAVHHFHRRTRRAGEGSRVGPMAHEEREQTLNQLLVEMDGFDSRAGVILMAATNRPEILDPHSCDLDDSTARSVDRPDKIGRLAILKVHAAPSRSPIQPILRPLPR